MIQVSGLTKTFDGFTALNGLDLRVKGGSIYGLIGTNGSGKTTLIRHLTGVLRPDCGEVLLSGLPVWENAEIKRRIGYIPDDLYFFANYNLRESARFYRSLYPRWSQTRYEKMCGAFQLDRRRRISRLSKGMQKQAAFILTMSATPDILILDEPIDGLDPLVRRMVWNFIVEDVAERGMTVLVSSHNLREMEGICDCIGILNAGKMVIQRDLDELKSDVHKIQVAYSQTPATDPYQALHVLHRESRGSVDLLIVRGPRQEVESAIRSFKPILFDVLPLSLEEIFIYELGGENHEFHSILF